VKTFNDLRESRVPVDLTEAAVSRSDFDKLKKGMRIEIDFGSSISSSQKRVFTVKSTSRSAKYNVDKVNMTIDGRGKYHLYSRNGKDATLALGNMAASIKSYKILGTNESIEEAKLSDMGIHNKIADRNLLIKAIKTAEKMGGNMTGAVREIEKMKKGLSKHKAVQAALQQANESVELGEEHLTEVKWTLRGKEIEVSKLTPAQIAQMRKMFGKIKTVRDDNPYKKKGKDMIADLSKLELKIVAKAKIRWLSDWAEEELRKRAPLDRRIYIESSEYMESVEINESPDFMKMSKELLKHKSKGIEYEKAAAYVRAIHNNSNVNVQDKAFMGLTKMLKDMDDFTMKTTITKILKDNGFRVKGGQLMREEVEPIVENYRTLATKGMGAETKNSINVGRGVDFYEPKNGDKRMGKITKMTKSGYVVKDEKDGKSYTFAFHDSAKAKALLSK
jgi:hypothetical protein